MLSCGGFQSFDQSEAVVKFTPHVFIPESGGRTFIEVLPGSWATQWLATRTGLTSVWLLVLGYPVAGYWYWATQELASGTGLPRGWILVLGWLLVGTEGRLSPLVERMR